jgi:competence protein ComEA
LDALPGIGPAKAAAILRYREKHGPFPSIDDLAQVPGLGAAQVARLRDRVSAR